MVVVVDGEESVQAVESVWKRLAVTVFVSNCMAHIPDSLSADSIVIICVTQCRRAENALWRHTQHISSILTYPSAVYSPYNSNVLFCIGSVVSHTTHKGGAT